MLSRTILRFLEVVEVAHRGSTAGGRVVRLRVRLGKRVLGIYLRNSLNLLWVFFCCCRLGWYNWGIGCSWSIPIWAIASSRSTWSS